MAQFWVFGYGSLMWRPGFEFVESHPALIRGYHRSLCVYSYVHRGSPERPGLVLGLDRGGSCHGMAFRVAADKWQTILSYLRSREQVTSVYLEKTRRVSLAGGSKEVEAVTYVVDRRHIQYAGRLHVPNLVDLVRQGHGISGHCEDYVRATLKHLRAMNIHDRTLEQLALELGT